MAVLPATLPQDRRGTALFYSSGAFHKFWTLALLMVLEPVFGIQPTAFVAALGVSSVIVSFGLQTTISNVISGLGLMVGHIIEVGDWIEVGGYQGVVTDITWRSTTIKALIGDVIVIPNSVLNTTTLRKLAPLSARAITISLDIRPEADMTEVERGSFGRRGCLQAVARSQAPHRPHPAGLWVLWVSPRRARAGSDHG